MRWVGTFLVALSMPLVGFGGIAAFIAAIWLIVLGDWRAVLAGALIMAVGYSAIRMIGLLPMAGCVVAAYAAINSGRMLLGKIAIGVGNAYTLALETIWSVTVFLWFGRFSHAGNEIPLVIWAFVVANGVWIILGKQEYRHRPTTISLVVASFHQVAFVVFYLSLLIAKLSLLDAVVLLVCLKVFGLFYALSLRKASDDALQDRRPI